MKQKLIMILIDGVSADYFAKHRHNMPHISALADSGLWVKRLQADIPAVSLPARATMLTGVVPQTHGVYGNHVYDATLQQFRHAAPTDIRVPTLAAHATAAGLHVASIGYGMSTAPEVQTFTPAWWLKGYIHKGREDAQQSLNVNSGWAEASHEKDLFGALQSLYQTGFPQHQPDDSHFPHPYLANMAAESRIIQRVTALACGDCPPDFLLTEIAVTDDFQHSGGYESELAHFAITQADMLIGRLCSELKRHNRDKDYTIAIAADHGHSPIHTAIYPDAFLPNDTPWSAEGSMLHAYLPTLSEQTQAIEAFKAIEVKLYPNKHLPKQNQSTILCFLAPDGFSFESRPEQASQTTQTGQPKYISSHGLRPGHPADDRLCVFNGKGISSGIIASANAVDFTPTLADILGLPITPYQGVSLLASAE